jgi:hypothetical protein
MHIKITDGVPEFYQIERLRKDHPDTSFPSVLTDQFLAEWNIYPLKMLPAPSYDRRTHYLKQSPVYQVDGVWQVHFSVEPLPTVQAENAIKSERNRLLSESDWVVTKALETQTAVHQDWLEYRQQLRDVTNQANYPFDVQWPNKP